MVLKKQVLRFILIGIVNTVFYYLLYASLVLLGVKYFFAVTLATIIGILFSYKAFSKVVFNAENNDKSLIKFVLVYMVNIALNIFIIKLYLFFDNNLYIGGFIATIIVAVFSFFLNKFYVFKVKINE